MSVRTYWQCDFCKEAVDVTGRMNQVGWSRVEIVTYHKRESFHVCSQCTGEDMVERTKKLLLGD